MTYNFFKMTCGNVCQDMMRTKFSLFLYHSIPRTLDTFHSPFLIVFYLFHSF